MLTREQLVERVRRIIDVDGSDEELESLAHEINACIAHPDIIDLIYDSEQVMTPEEIVDKALTYKPRVLQVPVVPESNQGR